MSRLITIMLITGIANCRPTVLLILDGNRVLKRVTERCFKLLRLQRRWYVIEWVRSNGEMKMAAVNRVQGEKPITLPLCPQIPYGLAWDRNRIFAVRARRLIGWATARPWTGRINEGGREEDGTKKWKRRWDKNRNKERHEATTGEDRSMHQTMKQDRKCRNNVTFRRFAQPLLWWKSNKCYIFWVCLCNLRYSASNAHVSCCHLWPVWIYEGWNFNSGNYLFTTDTK